MLRAGLDSPERVYAGLIGDPDGLLSAEDASTFQLQPPLPLHEQVCVRVHAIFVIALHITAEASGVEFVMYAHASCQQDLLQCPDLSKSEESALLWALTTSQ